MGSIILTPILAIYDEGTDGSLMQNVSRLNCDRNTFAPMARGVGGGRFWNAKDQYADGEGERSGSVAVSTARNSRGR